MFIQTINNLNNKHNNQESFDTRNRNFENKIEDEIDEKLDIEFVEKIEKLIKSYNSNLQIISKVTLKDGKTFEGVIKNFVKNKLYINDKILKVEEIEEIIALKINI